MVIESYETLSALANAQLRKGVRTNTSLSPAEYAPPVEVISGEDHLLIFRQRPGHRRMNFFLNALPPGDIPANTVTEISARQRDTALWETAAQLETLGFVPVLHRIRMTRKGQTFSDVSPEVIQCTDAEGALAFLWENFSPLTGCLPTEDEMKADIAAGHVLALADADGIAGLLHWGAVTGGFEIRHLALRQDSRGQGLTAPLIGAFLSRIGEKRAVVWLTEGNIAARRAYEKFDFCCDGYRSVVLYKE